MQSTQLNRAPIKPPLIQKLDMRKTESASPQTTAQSKLTAQHRLTGDGWVRVTATALILGQLWKEFLSLLNPIFKKRTMTTQNNGEPPAHINLRKKTKPIVNIYQPLGYILYEATTSPWVTFSYELTITPHGTLIDSSFRRRPPSIRSTPPDRGRKRLTPSPPSEPCVRFSCTRLSSR